MREIIFRGKSKTSLHLCEDGNYRPNQFVYGGFTKENGKPYILTESDGIEILEDTLGQYTGILDKNGNRIFEGDICLSEYGVGYSSKHYPSFADGTQKKEQIEIKFVQDEINNFSGFNFKQIDDENFCVAYEVIGNIHEKD